MIKTISNKIIPIIIKDTLYVPDLPVRLISPQQLAKQSTNLDDECSLRPDRVKLVHNGHTFSIPYHSTSNLPILHTVPQAKKANHHIQSHLCAWNINYLAGTSPQEGPPLHILQLDQNGNIKDPSVEDPATEPTNNITNKKTTSLIDNIQVPPSTATKKVQSTLQSHMPTKCVPIELPIGTEDKELP